MSAIPSGAPVPTRDRDIVSYSASQHPLFTGTFMTKCEILKHLSSLTCCTWFHSDGPLLPLLYTSRQAANDIFGFPFLLRCAEKPVSDVYEDTLLWLGYPSKLRSFLGMFAGTSSSNPQVCCEGWALQRATTMQSVLWEKSCHGMNNMFAVLGSLAPGFIVIVSLGACYLKWNGFLACNVCSVVWIISAS
jgi:hypothetical protein